MMRILLFGAGGQLGTALRRSLSVCGEVVPVFRGDRYGADFASPDSLRAVVRDVHPSFVVNAAAYTDVDGAERDPETAFTVNGAAPGVLAEEAAALGSWLVHFSTEHVFPGDGSRGWTETDAPDPVNRYGHSKLEGERRIREVGARHLVLRTSWLYAAHGRNFLRTMLRLARERDQLQVVGDQYGCPTSADMVADVVAHCLRAVAGDGGTDRAGLYHLAAGGGVSRHEYVRLLLEEARSVGLQVRVTPEQVLSVASQDFPAAAGRPRNSALATERIQEVFGVRIPPWEDGVRLAVELLAERSG